MAIIYENGLLCRNLSLATTVFKLPLAEPGSPVVEEENREVARSCKLGEMVGVILPL